MPLSGAISVEVVSRADAAGSPVFWANRWEVGASFGGAGLDPTTVADQFANFHLALMQPNFFLDYVRLSTYAADGEPYNPDSLFVLPVNVRGNRSGATASTTVLPLTNVLHIRKLVASGRLGHLFIRGFLTEGDIQSDPSSGAVSLVDGTVVQATVATAYTTLAAALGSGANISLISGTGGVLQERNVTSLRVAGISSRSFTTRRKSRLTQNSLANLANTLLGGVTLDEIPSLVNDVRQLARAVGTVLP